MIKSRNSNTTAVLHTFNLQEHLYSVNIPGQPSDTAVYRYQDRLLICHNCYKYGHTKAGCRRKGVWRTCREDDHTSDKTNNCSNESKCADCGERHMVGSNDCEIEKKLRVNEKCKLIAEWEDKELFKYQLEKTSLQGQTCIHILHFSDAKWIQKRRENSTRWQQNRASPKNWKQTRYHKIK